MHINSLVGGSKNIRETDIEVIKNPKRHSETGQ